MPLLLSKATPSQASIWWHGGINQKNNQFEILNRYPGDSAIIQEADLPDTIVFMLKNSTFWLDEDIETEEDRIHAEKLRRARVRRVTKKVRRHLYLVKK